MLCLIISLFCLFGVNLSFSSYEEAQAMADKHCSGVSDWSMQDKMDLNHDIYSILADDLTYVWGADMITSDLNSFNEMWKPIFGYLKFPLMECTVERYDLHGYHTRYYGIAENNKGETTTYAGVGIYQFNEQQQINMIATIIIKGEERINQLMASGMGEMQPQTGFFTSRKKAEEYTQSVNDAILADVKSKDTKFSESQRFFSQNFMRSSEMGIETRKQYFDGFATVLSIFERFDMIVEVKQHTTSALLMSWANYVKLPNGYTSVLKGSQIMFVNENGEMTFIAALAAPNEEFSKNCMEVMSKEEV